MGGFKVTQRTKDGFFNATELLKQWNECNNSDVNINDFYREESAFLKDMGYKPCNGKEVYLPYHIFVQFANWISPFLFSYAFNLCETDDKRMDYINKQIEDDTYSILNDFKPRSYKSPNQTCTYIIKDGSGLFKIGKTSDINSRLKNLRVGNPLIELVHKIDKDIEEILHKIFEKKRVNGEWFSLSNDDLSFIKKKYPNVLPI